MKYVSFLFSFHFIEATHTNQNTAPPMLSWICALFVTHLNSVTERTIIKDNVKHIQCSQSEMQSNLKLECAIKKKFPLGNYKVFAELQGNYITKTPFSQLFFDVFHGKQHDIKKPTKFNSIWYHFNLFQNLETAGDWTSNFSTERWPLCILSWGGPAV